MINLIQEDIDKAIGYAFSLHGNDCGGHGIGHIRRVISNAKMIMKELKSGFSKNLVVFCCALHDVDDKKLDCGDSKRLDTFLCSGGYDDELCKTVKNIISLVSFSENVGKSSDGISLEGKIVRDADRLDALGAVGIARAFAYGGKTCRPMFRSDGENSSEQHFYDKLFLLPSLMLTEPAKREADRRVEIMKSFIDELHAENESK
ncbi:MAG: HD domain-containing protein [Clostridiales bacterium]|nr:HD domain-containing protein [Clostridiales bacterium]